MLNKKPKNLFLIIIIVAVLATGFVYYVNYNLKVIRQDYESRISDLNKETAEKLQQTQQSLLDKINFLNSNLSSQLGLLDTSLQNFKSQNQEELNTLSNLIEQIEQQSNIRLNELKNDLKNIKIKSADFSAIVDDVLQSVVSIGTNVGQGSGVVIDKQGYIVTNLHVIEGASTIRATTYAGKTYKVNVIVGYDSLADIAVLKIDAPDLASLNFGNSNDVKVGQKVIAAGNPAGLAFTITEGIVSAFRKSQNNINYIQTDVPINPGNSGGPLVNAQGDIIGINNFKIGGFEGLGFAVSSNDVKESVDKIISQYESAKNQ